MKDWNFIEIEGGSFMSRSNQFLQKMIYFFYFILFIIVMESRQTTLDEYWFKKIPEDICKDIIDNILKEKSDGKLVVIQSPDASVHASVHDSDEDGC